MTIIKNYVQYLYDYSFMGQKKTTNEQGKRRLEIMPSSSCIVAFTQGYVLIKFMDKSTPL